MQIELHLISNIKNEEHYAKEKLKIQVTVQDVSNNTNDFRIKSKKAKKILALGQKYDEMAEKIISNWLLRLNIDQHVNFYKLNTEIAEPDKKSQRYL